LIFNEPVTPAGAGIKVFSPTGNQVAAPATAKGSVLSAPLRSSESGSYVVSWQILAADTHPSRGAFRFVVGRPTANPYSTLLDSPEIGTATPLGLGLQALARLVHFAGFALVFGVVGYQALIRPHQPSTRLTAAGVVLLIAAEPLAFAGQLASLSFDGDTALAVLDSSFGRLLGLRLGAAFLVWTLMATRRYWVLLAMGAVVAVLDGFSAHAIPGLPGAGQLLVAVHVGAMGLWVGGLVGFLHAPDRRFARYAAATLSIAVATGIVLALIHTGFGSGLLTTAYGRVLLLKVVVVGAALSAAFLRRHRPELAAALVVIAAAALLAALPPVV
jgi:copper transport protein